MSWATCYNSSNNIHTEKPGMMSDGRIFTLYNPACELNKKIEKSNKIKNNFEYRQFLCNNGLSIINKNNLAACNESSECMSLKPGNNISYGKYLFKSLTDNHQPYGYQKSDLKNMYLSRQELNNTYVAPIVPQSELLKYASFSKH